MWQLRYSSSFVFCFIAGFYNLSFLYITSQILHFLVPSSFFNVINYPATFVPSCLSSINWTFQHICNQALPSQSVIQPLVSSFLRPPQMYSMPHRYTIYLYTVQMCLCSESATKLHTYTGKQWNNFSFFCWNGISCRKQPHISCSCINFNKKLSKKKCMIWSTDWLMKRQKFLHINLRKELRKIGITYWEWVKKHTCNFWQWRLL